MSRHFDDWIDAYMTWQGDSESPESYKKWMAIGVVCACLQKKCKVMWTDGFLHPNEYIILVGPSGEARKGTAMSPAQRLLRDLAVNMSANAATLQALILDMKDAFTTYQPPGSIPIPHCSLCVFSKELTVLLGYQDKDMFANLCDWYDCDPEWKKRTVSRDVEEIVGLCVTLLGATTPMSLQSCLPMDAIGGGFTSRVIYVYEGRQERLISPWRKDRGTSQDDKYYKSLLNDLRYIKHLGGEFIPTDEAIDYLTDWYEKGGGSKKKLKDKRFSGYNSRRAAHVAKLSMAMSASRGDDMKILKSDLERAIEELDKVEQKMEYVFSGVGMNPYAAITMEVLDFCKQAYHETGDRKVNIQALTKRFADDLDNQTLSNIIADLEQMGYMAIREGPTRRFFEYTGD